MNQDIFKNLPSEIIIDILSRLPMRSVISCKCVRKSWFHLLETQEFVKSHLSKSAPGLIICEGFLYKFFEIDDGLDVEHHDLHYKLATEFEFTNAGIVMGSIDGLFFQWRPSTSKTKQDALCICNPITREYINLHCPHEFQVSYNPVVAWGFGSSKITSQYKVVRIRHDRWPKYPEVECLVYTLGTRLWRRLASGASLVYRGSSTGVFANENLHWLVCDCDRIRISCFELETEQFSILSAPPFQSGSYIVDLFVWGDCLGLSDNTSLDKIVIWSMKEYGVEKLWTKEIVISNYVF